MFPIREEITLMLSNTGKLLSVSYVPLVSPLAPACNTLSPIDVVTSKELKFQTTVDFETATPGMAIPLVLPQTKPPTGLNFFPRGKDGGKDGAGSVPLLNPEAKDSTQNQSFFIKYWYIVLPLTIMTMLNNGGADEAPSGEGGPPATGAVPAAAAAVGVAAVAGGAKPRRGKRG
jgi:hypothetical protein